MSYIFTGSVGSQQLQSSVSVQGNGSWVVQARHRGIRGYIDSLVSALPAGTTYSVQPEDGSPIATLTVDYIGSTSSTESPITTEWQFTTRASQVPITEHPDIAAALDALETAHGSDGLKEFRGLMDDPAYVPGSTTIDDYITADSDLVMCLQLNWRGTKNYYRPDPVLNLQRRYQPQANFRPDLASVGTVYTNAQLDTLLAIPTDIEDVMPDGEWICEEVDYGSAADGSRVATMSFRYESAWDAYLYTHAT
jgi:hypothetical protein